MLINRRNKVTKKAGDQVKLLSIVLPCFNEEEVIEETYRQLSEIFPKLDMETEVIFVNDGSQDDTMLKLRKIEKQSENVKILSFSRNFGHQIAITAGMDFAKGDAIVVIDSDLQDPVEVIVDMVDKWKKGFEVVYGKRIERKGESIFKKVSAKVFYKVLHNLTDETIPTDVGDFRLIDRKVSDALKNMPERSRYVRGLVAWAGFKTTSVEFVRESRFAGQTKYSLTKMIKLALDGIISFSYKPLKLASLLGCTISFISFLYLLYIIQQRIFTNNSVSGWTSIMVVFLFLSGIILIVLGIIGEYLARIYEEVKARPIYIIDDAVGIDSKEIDGR